MHYSKSINRRELKVYRKGITEYDEAADQLECYPNKTRNYSMLRISNKSLGRLRPPENPDVRSL